MARISDDKTVPVKNNHNKHSEHEFNTKVTDTKKKIASREDAHERHEAAPATQKTYNQHFADEVAGSRSQLDVQSVANGAKYDSYYALATNKRSLSLQQEEAAINLVITSYAAADQLERAAQQIKTMPNEKVHHAMTELSAATTELANATEDLLETPNAQSRFDVRQAKTRVAAASMELRSASIENVLAHQPGDWRQGDKIVFSDPTLMGGVPEYDEKGRLIPRSFDAASVSLVLDSYVPTQKQLRAEYTRLAAVHAEGAQAIEGTVTIGDMQAAPNWFIKSLPNGQVQLIDATVPGVTERYTASTPEEAMQQWQDRNTLVPSFHHMDTAIKDMLFPDTSGKLAKVDVTLPDGTPMAFLSAGSPHYEAQMDAYAKSTIAGTTAIAAAMAPSPDPITKGAAALTGFIAGVEGLRGYYEGYQMREQTGRQGFETTPGGILEFTGAALSFLDIAIIGGKTVSAASKLANALPNGTPHLPGMNSQFLIAQNPAFAFASATSFSSPAAQQTAKLGDNILMATQGGLTKRLLLNLGAKFKDFPKLPPHIREGIQTALTKEGQLTPAQMRGAELEATLDKAFEKLRRASDLPEGPSKIRAILEDPQWGLSNAEIERRMVSVNERFADRQAKLIDKLTDIPNKNNYDQMLEDALKAHQSTPEEGKTIGVLGIDTDNFKTVNDTRGHPVGDATLQLVANVLKRAVGDAGTAFRISGDEFAVIIPRATPEEIESIAKKIKTAINEAPGRNMTITNRETLVKFTEFIEPPTLSIGAVILDSPIGDPKDLTQAADAIMYISKRTKNTVTVLTTSTIEAIQNGAKIDLAPTLNGHAPH